MVVRQKRSTGERFLGCSRFPGCHGTRPFAFALPLAAASWHPRRPRSRAGWATLGIYLIERRLHRPLTIIESVVVLAPLGVAAFVGVMLFVTYAAGPIGEWFGRYFAQVITKQP
jgi:ssDNA-binding Zn-finger/Zn-ribbon topoisomerase 1